MEEDCDRAILWKKAREDKNGKITDKDSFDIAEKIVSIRIIYKCLKSSDNR